MLYNFSPWLKLICDLPKPLFDCMILYHVILQDTRNQIFFHYLLTDSVLGVLEELYLQGEKKIISINVWKSMNISEAPVFKRGHYALHFCNLLLIFVNLLLSSPCNTLFSTETPKDITMRITCTLLRTKLRYKMVNFTWKSDHFFILNSFFFMSSSDLIMSIVCKLSNIAFNLFRMGWRIYRSKTQYEDLKL